MKGILVLVALLVSLHAASAQSKATISALGARLDSTASEQTSLDEKVLSVIFTIQGLQYANTVSIGVGSVSIAVDGISTIFDVVKENRLYYLVFQNRRYNVENGTVTVFVPLNNKPEDYVNKYAIVKVTDKEGHTSDPQSVVIH